MDSSIMAGVAEAFSFSKRSAGPVAGVAEALGKRPAGPVVARPLKKILICSEVQGTAGYMGS